MTQLAQVQIAINGGAPISALPNNGQIVPSGALIALSGIGLTLQAHWEIYAYPKTWTPPAGWTLNGSTGAIESFDQTPTTFNIPATNVLWGTWLVRLTVNNGADPTTGQTGIGYNPAGNPIPSSALDVSTGWASLSPVFGFRELALYEGTQFGGLRRYVDSLQTMQHALESALGSATGNVVIQAPTSGGDAAYTITGTNGHVLVPITALTAPRTWQMPTAPSLGMRLTIVDSRRLYTPTNKITLTTAGGTDHFWVNGTDMGTTLVIDPLIYQGGSLTLVRMTSTTWETA